MESTTRDNAIILATQYAANNGCAVYIYPIRNGAHQVLRYEWYSESDPTLRLFSSEPELIIYPPERKV